MRDSDHASSGRRRPCNLWGCLGLTRARPRVPVTGFDWKSAGRDDTNKLLRALVAVGIAAANFGLVSVIWGVAAGNSGRVVNGVVELAVGLIVAIAVAVRLRNRSKRASKVAASHGADQEAWPASSATGRPFSEVGRPAGLVHGLDRRPSLPRHHVRGARL